jgi:pimeloyl-ACP methyl ester carboxylesterase
VRDRLTVHGHALEIASWGIGDPPIVMLHEGLGSVARWRDFPADLSKAVSRRVIAYSRAGHGKSAARTAPRTSRFMHEEALEWLPEILDRLDIARAVLLGHSDGASVSLIFAAEYPARVESLILMAPHVFVEDVSIESIGRARDRFATTNFRERLARYHDDVNEVFRAWNEVWLSEEFRAWNLEEYLRRIICPVLLIQGEQDEYGTVRQLEAIGRGVRGPVNTVLIPDCGHSPHRHQPEQTLNAITAFFARETARHSTAG